MVEWPSTGLSRGPSSGASPDWHANAGRRPSWVRWPTAVPPAGRGSRRFTMKIDVSVAVSEKSCCRQASARTGCAYGGTRTNRCRGRHCALVAQCLGMFPRIGIFSGFHGCRDWAKKRPRASITLACWRSNAWWVQCRARDFVNLVGLNSFSSASLLLCSFLDTFTFFSCSLWHLTLLCHSGHLPSIVVKAGTGIENVSARSRNKKYKHLTSWVTWTTQADSTRF